MPDKTSLYSFHKIAGLFPAVFLLLFLQAGVEGAVPCYFLPFFGRDVCGMQGGVELALPTASRGCSLVDDIRNGEMVEKKARMYKKCQAAIQKMHSGLIFRDALSLKTIWHGNCFRNINGDDAVKKAFQPNETKRRNACTTTR